MKITYIYHDCFAVELKSATLLFDYWKNPLPSFDAAKPLYVFASHVHPDHFSFDIFKLADRYPDVHFILSRDIGRRFNKKAMLRLGATEKAYERITFLGADQSARFRGPRATEPGTLVRTLPSTDVGVAFIIEADGIRLFHAGDLNDWSFGRNPDEINEKETKDFRDKIESVRGMHFNAAFFPLDGRQDDFCGKGFDYFMRITDTDCIFPMHYWKDTSVIDHLLADPVSEPYREKIMNPETIATTPGTMVILTTTPGTVVIPVERKRIRNLYIRFSPAGRKAKITAPLHMSDETISAFAEAKAGWLAKQLSRAVSHAPAENELPPDAASSLEARMQALIPSCEALVGKHAEGWRIRNMKTRWGSCSRKTGIITINLQLALKSDEILRYILIHELNHFWVGNHGVYFKKRMDRTLPEWRSIRKKLNG